VAAWPTRRCLRPRAGGLRRLGGRPVRRRHPRRCTPQNVMAVALKERARPDDHPDVQAVDYRRTRLDHGASSARLPHASLLPGRVYDAGGDPSSGPRARPRDRRGGGRMGPGQPKPAAAMAGITTIGLLCGPVATRTDPEPRRRRSGGRPAASCGPVLAMILPRRRVGHDQQRCSGSRPARDQRGVSAYVLEVQASSEKLAVEPEVVINPTALPGPESGPVSHQQFCHHRFPASAVNSTHAKAAHPAAYRPNRPSPRRRSMPDWPASTMAPLSRQAVPSTSPPPFGVPGRSRAGRRSPPSCPDPRLTEADDHEAMFDAGPRALGVASGCETTPTPPRRSVWFSIVCMVLVPFPPTFRSGRSVRPIAALSKKPPDLRPCDLSTNPAARTWSLSRVPKC